MPFGGSSGVGGLLAVPRQGADYRAQRGTPWATVFRSRRQAEQAVKELEQLRTNLAHAQDFVAADWATIVQLCDFIVDTDRGWGNLPDERDG
jgi:hypothetical protein